MVRQLGWSAERFACLAVQGGLWVNDSRRLSRGCETKSFGEMNLPRQGWARRSLLELNLTVELLLAQSNSTPTDKIWSNLAFLLVHLAEHFRFTAP